MAGVPLRRVADFPLHSLQQLNRIGILSCGDLLRLGRLQVCEIVGVSTSDADALLDLAARKACPESSSALEMWKIQEEEESRPYAIPTLLRYLDSKLGGIRKGCITEICGPAGVGKSTLSSCVAVQCAAPVRQGGHNAPVIVLDTELKFSAERLAEIALCRFPSYFGDSVAGPDRIREMLGKITVLSVRSARELDITMGRLEDAAARTSAGLVIFDSVAALARDGFGAGSSFARVARLNRHAAQLKRIAESLGLAVLVTNQVSGRAPRNPSGSAASSRAAERPSSTWVLPALGVVWTHAVNVRVVMDVSPVQPLGDWRERKGGGGGGEFESDGYRKESIGGGRSSRDRSGEEGMEDEDSGGVADPTLASAEALLRRIHVIKSPTAPATVVPFVITEAGVVDPPVELIAALPQGADLGARGGASTGGTAAAAGATGSGGSSGYHAAPVGAGGHGGQLAQGGLRAGSLPAVASSSFLPSYHGDQAVSMGASHGGAMVASADEAAALAAAADYLLAGIGGEDEGVHEAGAASVPPVFGGVGVQHHDAGGGLGVTSAGATEMDLLAGAMDDLEAEAEAELLMAELETAAGYGVTSAGAGGSGGLVQGSGVQAMERGYSSGGVASSGATSGPWHGDSAGRGAVRGGGSGAQVAMDGGDEVDDLLYLAAELD